AGGTMRWADGTTIAGWARKEELAPASTHSMISDLPAMPSTCTLAPTTRGSERILAAAVATGTEVFAARYLGPWAKVVDGRAVSVRVRPKDDWVEIVVAQGLESVTE